MLPETFHFELVSPEKLIFSAEAEMVVIPGEEGDFAVMPGHAPLLSAIRPGMVDIMMSGSATHRIFIRGGFADISADNLTILAEFALPENELDVEVLNQQIQNAEEDVADATDDETLRRARELLGHLNLIKSAL